MGSLARCGLEKSRVERERKEERRSTRESGQLRLRMIIFGRQRTLSALANLCSAEPISTVPLNENLDDQTYLIGEDHQPVICLSSQDTSHALSRVSHGVKGEEVVLANPVGVAEVLESSFEDARFRVLSKVSAAVLQRRKRACSPDKGCQT